MILRNNGGFSTDCTAYIAPKIEFFITTALRATDPAKLTLASGILRFAVK
jgi:hypothetical protein